MQHAVYCKVPEKVNDLEHKPFQIFLSEGADVGTSFLVIAITKYLSLNLDNPFVLVTTSTGKAATNANGITWHSVFNFPVKSGLKLCGYQKPCQETLYKLRNKYQYLKNRIINEISMIGREIFEDLNIALKIIRQNLLPFGGVPLLLVGDVLQLPNANQKVCL